MFWSLALACALVAQAEEPSKAKSAPEPAAAEQEAARKKLEEDVTRLINRYVRGDLPQKQQVIQELLDKGPDILEVLPPIDEAASADRKQLLMAVRPKLEKQLAESAGKASLVSLKGEMLLSQALASLEKQSGNKIVDQRDGAMDPTIKVNVAKVPFWQALDGVLDISGLTTNLYADRPGVGIAMRPEGEVPQSERRVAYSGPFRLEVTGIEARRNARVRDRQTMRLALEVAWEPRLSPISLRLPFSAVKAIDDQGKPIAASAEGVSETSATPGTFGQELTVPLALPSRDVKKIASLKGTLDVLLPGRTSTFKFEKIKRGDPELKTPLASQRQSGVQVISHRVVQNGEEFGKIGIVLRFDKAEGALASHRDWYAANQTYLLDANGKEIAWDRHEPYRRTEDDVGMLYTYDLPGGPDGLTLVYKTPSLIMNLPVSFEIKDIELP